MSAGADDNHRLLWRNEDGRASIRAVAPGGAFLSGFEYGPFPGWAPLGLSTGADNRTRLLWGNTFDYRTSLWLLTPTGAFETGYEFAP